MSEVVNTWFKLREEMLRAGPEAASAIRPPSLRDACYAEALAHRTATEINPAAIEAYINGLELGAMAALKKAWVNRDMK
jgi:hypothetical protein